MLPGFRFLFTAVVLSMSILVFGLGAAALLRTAHEEFASLPTRRATPEPMFPRPNDNLIPTLALLRVDPPVADKPLDNAPAAAAPEIVAPAEQAADARPQEPEKLAALKPEESPPAEAVKPEIPAVEAIVAPPAAPAETETPVANADVKLAAAADTPEPPAATASTAAEPAADAPSTEGSIPATRIATLGGPAVIIDEALAKATDAKPDQSAAKKRAAQRARERRRIARRARLAREAAALALQQQQANNPFAQLPLARTTR
jgi:hypothetical protein